MKQPCDRVHGRENFGWVRENLLGWPVTQSILEMWLFKKCISLSINVATYAIT